MTRKFDDAGKYFQTLHLRDIFYKNMTAALKEKEKHNIDK